MPQVSLIAAFYNKVDYLELLFAGLERQTEKNFEFLIADDGSNPGAVSKVQLLIERASFPVKHVWHEDQGWRKNKILNKAVVQSNGDYLIFTDADCVPHSSFVEEHLSNRGEHLILAGSRAHVSQGLTRDLTYDTVKDGILERSTFRLLLDGIKGQSNQAERAIYVKSPLARAWLQRKKTPLLGCNFSIHKQDLLALNGFDERYQAPTYGEDGDILLRGQNNGLSLKSVKNIAVLYNLYHQKRDFRNENVLIYNDNKANKIIFTPYGIDKSPESRSNGS